jgi:hypothetical protein
MVEALKKGVLGLRNGLAFRAVGRKSSKMAHNGSLTL